MGKVRLIFTDDDLWVYDVDNPSAHIQYTTLVAANLDAFSVTISADALEVKRADITEAAPDITWHDMRKAEETPAEGSSVVVYDDPVDFLADALSPQWPPPD